MRESYMSEFLASTTTQAESMELARSMSMGMKTGDFNKSVILNVMINSYINKRMPDLVRIALDSLIDSFLHDGMTTEDQWEMLSKSMLGK